MNTEKTNIIEQAYHHLANALDINIDRGQGDVFEWHILTGQPWDAVFNLNVKKIYVTARNEIRPVQAEQLFRLKEGANHLLVAANYITPAAKLLLKEKEINYVDRAGNIFFKVHPIHVYIEGVPNRPPAEERKNRAFTKAGLKTVFQVLTDPAMVNATYRELAAGAKVALGTIPQVIRGLEEEGFLLRGGDRQKWIIKDVKVLLDRWEQEYNRRLRPALFVKRFRPAWKNFHEEWKELIFPKDTVWGGEPAADILTNYLRPQWFTVYTQERQQDLMKKYRWIPDEKGEIFVYRKFWDHPVMSNKTAPVPLVYADLMDTGDGRCIETANMIYEQYIRP